MYGGGLRRWRAQGQGQVQDVQVLAVIKDATSGIKNVIKERQLEAKGQWTQGGLAKMGAESVRLSQDQEVEEAMDVPQVAVGELTALDDHVIDSVHCRVLKPQRSDVSTCCPDGASEVGSCADTEIFMNADVRRHPRKPRQGRRARARERRLEYEEATKRAYLEGCREMPGDLCGSLLSCIVEDEDDAECMQRCGGSMDGAEGGGCSGDGDNDSDEGGGVDDALEEEYVEGTAKQSPQMVEEVALEKVAIDEVPELIMRDGDREDADSSADESRQRTQRQRQQEVEGDSTAEYEKPWEHELFEDVVEGVRLLPVEVGSAILGFHVTARACLGGAAHDLQSVVAELRPKADKLEDAVAKHEEWDFSACLQSPWAALQEWLVGERSGPCGLVKFWEEFIEDAEDECDEQRMLQSLENEYDQTGMLLSDCWEGSLERLEDVDMAARREAYIVQKRSHDRKEVQDSLQQRFQQSLMDRG